MSAHYPPILNLRVKIRVMFRVSGMDMVMVTKVFRVKVFFYLS